VHGRVAQQLLDIRQNCAAHLDSTNRLRIITMPPVHGHFITNLEAPAFDQFLVYLNDHLLDNGNDGNSYFQPLSRAEPRFPIERENAFRSGLSSPLGEGGWRRLWVARNANGEITGHVDLRSHPERYAQHRCLLGMGVRRDYRRIGLGGALLTHAEEWTASQRIEWIDLQVLSNNDAAVQLYLRSGFHKTAEIPDMFRIDGHSLSYMFMSKIIEGRRTTDA
jgi:ribosomal protein S18 acetylase RimI-like enzyme